MLDSFPTLKNIPFPSIVRDELQTLQINLGYRCNLQCKHCHVNASPQRKEMMSRENINLLLDFVNKYQIKNVDLTGGAPEMHPEFKFLIETLSSLGVNIIVRSNLVILAEPDYEHLIDLFVKHNVTITASLPCYLQENVDKQRGKGTFQHSIDVLNRLNSRGYGRVDTSLQLNLVYNPQGPELPPPQNQLEQDYKAFLKKHYEIEFDQLYTITNIPIKRFGSMLMSKNKLHDYMQLLKDSFSPDNIQGVMCRTLISVDWQGYIFDCDFNQMLQLPIIRDQQPLHISHFEPQELKEIPIEVAGHCYGCTAGQGSSCGGSLS